MTGSITSSCCQNYWINAPVVSMRQLPAETSEVVSQAYYSEKVDLLETSQDWVKIATMVDRYLGWIPAKHLYSAEQPCEPSLPVAKVSRCMAHLYHVPDTIYGPLLTLPFESRLRVVSPQEEWGERWIKVTALDGREGFIQQGDVSFHDKPIDFAQVPLLSLQFFGLPYTWGGRSSFGYDCSGFVQMLYRQAGIYLPRDAKDQIKWEGFCDVSLDNLIPGDLIFFGLDQGRIRHVGMFLGLGTDQFIHATVGDNAPYIHISRLSDSEWSGEARFSYRAARRLA